MVRKFGWYWYLSKQITSLEKNKCGKWMCFFDNQEFAQQICQKAIDENACYECKCTDMEKAMTSTGVICFYANGDDVENHKRIIRFLLENGLIRRTKMGKLYNISFKFDHQTKMGEYGADFNGKIKLDQFVDLQTGQFIV